MFTGIIEDLGVIERIEQNNVAVKTVLSSISIGDSVAVNGICLTVTSLNAGVLTFDYSPETREKTSLSGLKSGGRVNLERAMAANGRFGGHLLSGHIEGITTILGITKSENAFVFRFSLPATLAKYVVEKGSTGIDGISLTIASVEDNAFTAAVIPHTMRTTNLMDRKANDIVNIETDILAKYVENMLNAKNKTDTISESFLKENGFV